MRSFGGLTVLLSALAAGCGGPTVAPPVELPAELLPASFEQSPPDEEAREISLRVYAGRDFRSRVVNWESKLQKVVHNASQVLSSCCSVTLVLQESVDWERSGGNLKKSLDALVAHDAATDVDLVVGLIDAPEGVEEAYDTLVLGSLLGDHLVLRSFNRGAEADALRAENSELGEAQLEVLLERYREHKQSALLLHGIASLVGGAASEQGLLSSPLYTRGAVALDERSQALLRIVFEAKAEEDETAGAWKRARSAMREAGAFSDAMDEAIRLRARRRKGAQEDLAEEMRPEDREALATVREQLAKGKAMEAWASLEPILELYPDYKQTLSAACVVARTVGRDDARERCEKALERDPEDGSLWLALGVLQVDESPDRAIKSFRKAQELGRYEETPFWRSLVRQYRQLDLVTLAEEAAIKGGSSPELEAWIRKQRLRYGVSVGVGSSHEGRYYKKLRDALQLVYAKDYDQAAAFAVELEREYPDGVGHALVGCETAVRKKAFADALAACGQVLARQADNSWALYLRGVALSRSGKKEEAKQSLKKALELDPKLEPAEKALDKLGR